MKKPDPELIDEENPEWTEEDFSRARPAREIHPEWAIESIRLKNARGDTFSFHMNRKHKSLTSEGLDGRQRDLKGKIGRKSGNVRVDSLRKTYGKTFGREVRGDATLDTLLKRTGARSLSDYLQGQSAINSKKNHSVRASRARDETAQVRSRPR